MSSDESTDREGQAKKRRVQRACDVCRRKKIRCDGAQMVDHKCSNCISYNFECTYNEAARKRCPPKGYVELLENRLEKMEGLLQKLCPDGDFTQELGGRFDKETWLKTKGAAASVPVASSSKSTFSPSGSGSAQSPRSPSDEDDYPSSDDDVPEGLTLSTWLEELQINPATPRFFGKSSGARLVKSAMALKSDLTGVEPRPASVLMQDLRAKRPEYWHIHPWEQKELSADADRLQRYNFPDADLMPQLVDRYFTEINIILPVLHRPTFERSIAEGLHLKDDGFASVLLVVCSAGARYVDDPRVFLEGASTHSAGWKWFNQVQMVRKSLLAPPRLYDIQLYCLATMFLQGSSAPQACWSIVGIGIRLAQDIGAHRRKMYAAKPSVHDELWKRAFWVLVAFDRGISSGLGRPCAIQDEDFDVDLPLMVDDEYWENEAEPEKAFQQPEGKPSKIAAFVCLVKLNQILAFALRTIYSINKSKVLLGFVGPQWEQNIVSELDSALNKWIDSIPDHLRWDPKREDTDFFHQSATLYVSYYQLQIAIHRPFIPNRNRQGTMALPALAICTNAARSSSHVMDIHQTRRNAPLPIHMPASFTAGIVLLLSIWGGKRGGVILDPAKEMADVYRCMNILKRCEGRWHIAGRFWDILWELASVSDLPLPEYNPGPVLKRDREEDAEVQQGQAQAPVQVPSQVPQTHPGGYVARSIAGNRRVKGNQADLSQQAFLVNPASSAGPPESNIYSASFPPPASAYEYQGSSTGASQYYQPPHVQQQQWLPPDLGDIPQTYNPIPDPSTYANPPLGSTFPVNFEQPGIGMQQSWWPQDSSFGASAFDQMFSGMYGSPPTTTDTASVGVHDQFNINMLQGMYQPKDPVLEAQAQTGYVNPETEGTFSNEALSLWADAPGTFVSDDWSSFIMGMSDPSMGIPGPVPGPSHPPNPHMPGAGQAGYGQYGYQ